MLLLFTFTTALGLVNFHNMQDESVSSALALGPWRAHFI